MVAGNASPVSADGARSTALTPNGDGRSDYTAIRYRLRQNSLVTATVVDSAGAPVTTLFVEQKSAGQYEFLWDALGLADGRYGIVLSARNDIGIEATATVAVIVDRTLAGYGIVPQVFSPNGDGRLDTTHFQFALNATAQVSLSVRRGTKVVGQVFVGQLPAGPQAIEWNGRFRSRVGEHEYRADLSVTSPVTTVVQIASVRGRHDRSQAPAPQPGRISRSRSTSPPM